jgi:hypothetical protein
MKRKSEAERQLPNSDLSEKGRQVDALATSPEPLSEVSGAESVALSRDEKRSNILVKAIPALVELLLRIFLIRR